MASKALTPSTEPEKVLPEKVKENVKQQLVFGLFLAVIMHVLCLQSDVTIFSRVYKGNQGLTARGLARTVAATGIFGLFVNQVGGNMSDSLGRKPFFLIGPLVNAFCAMLVVKYPNNVLAISTARVLKSIFITFSGTVMTQAALADVCSGQEMMLVATKIQAAVGAAVVGGPYIESLLLKLGGGNPLITYKAFGYLSFFQLACNNMLPETLIMANRVRMPSLREFLVEANPFTFIDVYLRGKNLVLKKLLTIQTFQFCCDGKVTSDLFQLWSRNVLKWSAEVSRDFVAFWGAAVTMGGYFVQPWLVKRLSTYAYSTLTNICVGTGLCTHGIAVNGLCMWAGVPFLVPGVNGGNALAIKTLAQSISNKEGYGKGKFSAWCNNMRALVQAAQTLCLGAWYARCQDQGIYLGTTWWWAGFVGAWLPQLLMLTMSKKEFVDPSVEDASQ